MSQATLAVPNRGQKSHSRLRSRRNVLRIGYGAVIALLVFASFEAYRVQEITSNKSVDLWRRYVQQDEAMAAARYSVWLAGNRVREFFIYANPSTAEKLRRELTDLKAECDRSMQKLEELKAMRNPEAKAALQDFWDTLMPVPDTMLRATDQEQYNFVRQEIAPRRSSLYSTFRELLTAEQGNLQRFEAELSESRRNSAGRLIVMLAMCVALALVVARFSIGHSDSLERATEEQLKAIEQARQELEQLSARLVDVEEEGRKRLARELHDEIGQSLAILQIEISNALGLADNRLADIRVQLGRARAVAERTVQSVRNLSLGLRPALLDDLGLGPALQWLLEDFMRRSSVQCTFTATNIDDHLPDTVRTCIYRVVQEAIHNCEKHASASRVKVSIRQEPDGIVTEVEDNGRGFEVSNGLAKRSSGLGLIGMRERAARLGGTLQIDSSPGRGTRLRMVVPSPEQSSSAPEPTGKHAPVEKRDNVSV